MKTTIYIKVSVEDELPVKSGRYPVVIAYINRDGFEYFAQAEYSKEYSFHEEMMDCSLITHWLREVELNLPSDEDNLQDMADEIYSERLPQNAYTYTWNEVQKEKAEAFVKGAKYLREQLLKQLKIK